MSCDDKLNVIIDHILYYGDIVIKNELQDIAICYSDIPSANIIGESFDITIPNSKKVYQRSQMKGF